MGEAVSVFRRAGEVVAAGDAPTIRDALGIEIARALATERARAEAAEADMAEVREWSQGRGPLVHPYRPNTAGMLERLDLSFTRLRAIEDGLRADLTTALTRADVAERERGEARAALAAEHGGFIGGDLS